MSVGALGRKMFRRTTDSACHDNTVLVLRISSSPKAFARTFPSTLAFPGEVGEELPLLVVVRLGELLVAVPVEGGLVAATLAVLVPFVLVMFEHSVCSAKAAGGTACLLPPLALSPTVTEVCQLCFICRWVAALVHCSVVGRCC